MRNLFFCARDVSDYIMLDNKREILTAIGKISIRNILETEAAQKFFHDKMNLYRDRDAALSAPTAGETGIDGLRLDFNFGLRLEVPAGNFHVTIGDADTGAIFLDEDLSDVRLISVEKHFIRWQVDVSRDDKKFSRTRWICRGNPS